MSDSAIADQTIMPGLTALRSIKPLNIEGMDLRTALWRVNKEVERLCPFGEYGFSCSLVPEEWADRPMPDGRWIAVFPHRGGSEGWYVHIMVIPVQHSRVPATMIALAKCWDAREAWYISMIVQRLLGCV